MSSREILYKICEVANKQCEQYEFDHYVDFTKLLSMIYYAGQWRLGLYDPSEQQISYCYNANAHEPIIFIAPEASWHSVAIDNMIDRQYDLSKKFVLPIFSNKIIEFLDEECDCIFKKMLNPNGTKIKLNVKDHDAICSRYDAKYNAMMREIKSYWINNHGSSIKVKEMLNEVTKLDDEKIRLTEPIITLIPEGMHNLEELQIWLDLQC